MSTASVLLALAIAAIACAAYGFALLGLFGGLGIGDLFNSDLLGPYLLVRSVLTASGSIFDWFYAPSNYAFPDHFIALAAYLSAPWLLVPVFAGGMLLAGYAFAAAATVAFATGRPFVATLPAAALMIGVLAAFVAFNAQNGTGALVSIYLVCLYAHTGALVCGPFLIVIGLRTFLEPANRHAGIVLIGALALDAVASYSDLLFTVWFVVPLAAYGIVHGAAVHSRHVQRVAYGLLAVAAAVRLADMLSRRTYALGIDFPTSLATFWDTVVMAPAKGDVVVSLLLVLSLAMVVQGAVIATKWLRGRQPGRLDATCLVLTGVVVTGWAVPVLTGHFQYPILLRYSYASFTVPWVWLLLILVRLLPVVTALIPAVAASLVFVGGAVWLGRDAPALALSLPGPPSVYAACVLDSGRRAGFAEYWYAKPLVIFSDYRISAIAIFPDGAHRYEQAGNRAWAFRSADNKGPFAPTFILPKGLDEAALLAQFGAPAERKPCADTELWLYPSPLPVPPAPRHFG